MNRPVCALVLSWFVVSAAAAKTCIVIDTTGEFLDSQFVLLKAKLGPGNVAPAEGYLAKFDPGSNAYTLFIPLSGQSVVNHAGTAALGIVVYNVDVSSNGGGNSSLPNSDVQLLCEPARLGAKLGIGDMCFGSYGGATISGHLVTCGSSVAIP